VAKDLAANLAATRHPATERLDRGCACDGGGEGRGREHKARKDMRVTETTKAEVNNEG